MQVWLYQNVRCQELGYFINQASQSCSCVYISGVVYSYDGFVIRILEYYVNLEENNIEQLLTVLFYP